LHDADVVAVLAGRSPESSLVQDLPSGVDESKRVFQARVANSFKPGMREAVLIDRLSSEGSFRGGQKQAASALQS
jgi:hypothetical protein